MIIRCVLFLAVVFAASAAVAADQPRYGPPPAWVKPLTIPSVPPVTDGSPVQILIEDSQSRFGADADETYGEVAFRILTPAGLAAAASLAQSWNPDTETLTFHRLNIIRGGQTIDLLAAGKKVTVLRRETNLQLAMLDGNLTATVQPEGLQVGDVIDEAFTMQHHDPVFQGRSEAAAFMRFPGVIGRFYVRDTWPAAKPVRWLATPGMAAPSVSASDGTQELLIDQSQIAAPKPPQNAPPRFADVGEIQLSQFQSWSEVSTLMDPLYAKAATLAPGSPLLAEVDKIRKASADPKTQTEMALRLVQDQIHYVFLGMNFGGYVPADADVTWTRRFGDCKGKTALLLALLHALGVEAEPALVSTSMGDGLDQRLPMLEVFDHVFVRAHIGGKLYWLDGTRIGDRELDDIPLPAFHWVLPVQTAGGQLEKVEPRPFAEPAYESVERIDASAGYDAPAPAHAEQIYRGDAALVWHTGLDSLGRADAERALREHWRNGVPWIEPKSVDFSYDDQRHVLRLTMDGSAKVDWTPNDTVRDFQLDDSELGFATTFKREPGPDADAPFAVGYPVYDKRTVVIILPAKGDGFSLIGAPDVDETLAGRRFRRSARLENGVVTMVAQEQSLASEFPFAEAEAAGAGLTTLAATDVTVRGPYAPAAADVPDDQLTAAPTDAAGYSRRGAAFLNRGAYDHAIADFTEAARLEPQVGKHVYDRGVARFQAGQTDLALQDFDTALSLAPGDVLALMARADAYLAKRDVARADRDFDQALKLSPGDDKLLARRARDDDAAGRHQEAVRGFDVLLSRSPNDDQRAIVLDDRCWARAEWGRELAAALADCDAALALKPASPAVLDSRGFVRLRLGQYDQAIGDYDAALAIAPRLATSLFGRGLAETLAGRAAAGGADITAAKEVEPGVGARFAGYGVTPPGAGRP